MRHLFLLAIMLIGSFAFANKIKNGENNAPKSEQSEEGAMLYNKKIIL